MKTMQTQQAGISLIELMIAIAIGFFLSSVIIEMHISNRNTFSATADLANMQENLRFGSQIMSDEFRMTGYIGCVKPSNNVFTNTIPSPPWNENFAIPLVGYEAANTNPGQTVNLANQATSTTAANWSPALPITTASNPVISQYSDAILVSHAATATISTVTALGTNSLTAPGVGSMINNANLGTLPALYVSDCGYSQTFIPTSVSTSSVGYNSLTQSFPIGSEIMVGHTALFFVGTASGATEPSLFRQVGTQAPDSIADGIENMQILYGVDTDADGYPNQYMPGNTATMANVVTIRLGLLAQTNSNHEPSASVKTYTLAGTTVQTPSDQLMRQAVDLTFRIRNP